MLHVVVILVMVKMGSALDVNLLVHCQFSKKDSFFCGPFGFEGMFPPCFDLCFRKMKQIVLSLW